MITLFAEVAPHLAKVEGHMGSVVLSDEPRVQALIDSLGSFHGKMLRPALLLMVAETLGAVSEAHHRLGASLELIHTATLIHDDMIDEAATRRGQPTAHVEHGVCVAVLLGDYLYTHAFDLVSGLREPWVFPRLTRTTNIICSGELHQMLARRDVTLSEAEYGRIIYAKTAALTELAGELGALAGTEAQRAAAKAYGRACGVAFQIVDDCLDLSGDPEKVGKTLTTDIERGRLTLPFIRLLAEAPAAERDQIARRLLDVSGAEAIESMRRLAIERGAVTSALATARQQVVEAKGHLQALPAGSARDRLADLADFIVSRDF